MRHELEAYGHGLIDKPEIVALQQGGRARPKQLKEQFARLKRASKRTPLVVSAAAQSGVPEVAARALQGDRRRERGRAKTVAEPWRP